MSNSGDYTILAGAGAVLCRSLGEGENYVGNFYRENIGLFRDMFLLRGQRLDELGL
jgi:hypothetical protein